jgi:hypothetical protein
MSESARPNPTEALRQIEAGSVRVNQLATALSDRIKRFEDWITDLPGKVVTEVWVADTDDPRLPVEFGLLLSRSGKRWAVFHASRLMNEPFGPDWAPLADASVETKIEAVKLFPRLLSEITAAQVKLVKELERTHADFDAFAGQVGIQERISDKTAMKKEGK